MYFFLLFTKFSYLFFKYSSYCKGGWGGGEKNKHKEKPSKKQLSLYFLQQKKENKKKRLDENVSSRHK